MTMNKSQALARIAELWDMRGRIKTDWIRFETDLTAILSAESPISDSDRIAIAKELLAATTRRGNFDREGPYISELEEL